MSELKSGLIKLLSPLGVASVSDPARLGGGSSQENWAFSATWEDRRTGESDLLLRRDPISGVVETPRSVEFELLRALGPTELPVARVYAFDDGTLFDRPAMVVQRKPGVAHRGVLRESDPLRLGESGRLKLAGELATLLGQVHGVDVFGTGVGAALPVPPADPAKYELERWVTELDRVELEPQPALRVVAAWLGDNLPPAFDGPLRLVHGDFRPANVLVSQGAVAALLDWELARLGDPHDDLGWYTCSIYRTEHFLAGRWDIVDFLERWSAASGLPVEPDRLHFWQVMSSFRLAVIALAAVSSFCAGLTDRPAAPPDRVIRQALRETGLLAKAVTL